MLFLKTIYISNHLSTIFLIIILNLIQKSQQHFVLINKYLIREIRVKCKQIQEWMNLVYVPDCSKGNNVIHAFVCDDDDEVWNAMVIKYNVVLPPVVVPKNFRQDIIKLTNN